MKKHYLYIICVCFIVLGIFSCSDTVPVSKETSEKPILYPDYADVTIPNNIAPLNFKIQNAHTEAFAVFCFEEVKLQVKEKKGQFHIPAANWKKLLRKATGKTIQVKLYAKDKEWLSYPEFSLFIAQEPMDSYLAYRLIEPGYELWNQMGIYQRSLETYEQSPIMENKHSGQNCMNCHSFCMQNPNKMLFHMRDKYAGTYLIDGDKIEKLNTKTEQTISPLVYPSWHPSGKYVAFSVNQTSQSFHSNDKNRVEVFDSQSDVVVYDTEKHEIISTPAIRTKEAFETFPTFSPDGRTLYFCTAEARSMPHEYSEVKYNLCSIAFDPVTRSFGSKIDTLYKRMEKVSLFPVSLPTGNSCYSPYRATGTSLSGIKTLIYIFWISRVVFSIPYETRTAQTRRVIIRGVATTDGSFSAADESTDYIPDLISPISTRAEMPPNRSYYHRKIRISTTGS